MEGICADVGSILEQGQEFRRTGVKDLLRLGVGLPPGTAELDHRQSRLLCQAQDIGLQRAGAGNAVAENIPSPPGHRLRRQGGPFSRSQKQRGVQHYRRFPPGDLPDDLPALGLPDREVGETRKILAQLLLHPLRQAGHTEGGGVGDFPQRGKGAEEHRVKPPVGENDGVPNLVAAGDQQVIGQLRLTQFLPAFVAVGSQVQVSLGKRLKPLPALPEGGIV